MEWMNRGGSAPQTTGQQAASSASGHRAKGADKQTKVWRLATVFLLFTGTALVVALLFYLAMLKPSNVNASKHVDTAKYQAVFLNGGQVYFGKIKNLNSSYTRLGDIYYLRVNQQVQPNGTTSQGDVQLVKLGCELHGPADEMVINNDQVIFWENLKDDGQVAQAVAKYVKENPDGQKCNASSSNSSDSSTTPTTNTTTTNKKQ